MKWITLFLVLPLVFLSLFAPAQNKPIAYLSLEEVKEAMMKEEKLIVMNFSTDWCAYCKIQERQLKKNDEVSQLLNDRTYYITLNAETKDTLKFNNIIFNPSPYKGGIHELALAVSEKNEHPAFPMWVIFNKDYEIIFRKNGLVKPKDLVEVLKNLLPNNH
ncbi:MAG: thioredoxin family protein [Ginsengibacter sp.]